MILTVAEIVIEVAQRVPEPARGRERADPLQKRDRAALLIHKVVEAFIKLSAALRADGPGLLRAPGETEFGKLQGAGVT